MNESKFVTDILPQYKRIKVWASDTKPISPSADAQSMVLERPLVDRSGHRRALKIAAQACSASPLKADFCIIKVAGKCSQPTLFANSESRAQLPLHLQNILHTSQGVASSCAASNQSVQTSAIAKLAKDSNQTCPEDQRPANAAAVERPGTPNKATEEIRAIAREHGAEAID